jgi:hypothetical protein
VVVVCPLSSVWLFSKTVRSPHFKNSATGKQGTRPLLKWEDLWQIYGTDTWDGEALDYQSFHQA